MELWHTELIRTSGTSGTYELVLGTQDIELRSAAKRPCGTINAQKGVFFSLRSKFEIQKMPRMSFKALFTHFYSTKS